MQYLCLLYRQEQRQSGNQPGWHDQAHAESTSILCRHRLAGNDATAEVRVIEGALQVRDASTPAGLELAGVVLIEARDLNDAIRIAARFPEAHAGYIEVRPVRVE